MSTTIDILPKHHGEKVYDMLGALRDQAWDVIVIGSGMAGMSCAAALSKMGRKVLVLEQHYLPGGYTHMFTRQGYEWDVGVHAIGEMDGRSQLWRMWNWLAQDEVQWKSLGTPYDEFCFPEHYRIGFPNSKQAFIQQLKKDFPDETSKIDNYFATINQAARSAAPTFALKTLPLWFDQSFQWLWKKVKRDWWSLSTEHVLRELGLSEKLKTVLTAQWGYHGNLPAHSPFAIHALIVKHFCYGAYYPVGGAKVLAAALLARVKESGGQTICRAPVKQIIIKQNRAVGVELANGKQINAALVVSATSALVLVNKLLPQNIQNQTWAQAVKALEPSPSYISLYLGFRGDIAQAGASATNKWFFNKWERDQAVWNIDNPGEEAHILYVSFPSLKNPEHKIEKGQVQRHTGEVVTFVPWDCFKRWKQTDHRHRPEDYEQFKEQIKQRLLNQIQKLMPELMSMIEYSELSTPLSAQHFVQAPHGAIYGLDSSMERFKCPYLRTRSPIKGLYLSGVDVATTGVTGALVSGLLTAASIDARLYPRLL